MKSRTYIFVGLLISIILLAACAPVNPTATPEPGSTQAPAEDTKANLSVPTVEPVTIRYWHTMSQPETDQFQQVIDAFQAANPGITIEATKYAWADFKNAITTALAGGDVPDTIRMDIIWVPEYASQGALMQLDGTLPDFDQIASSVFPGPLATNKYQGHYYGLPQDTNTQVLVYNKDLLDKAGITAPPATMEEFADDACKLSDSANGIYGYAQGGTYFWAPAPIFYAFGGKIVDDAITTASGYINGPESVAAFTMLKDLYDKECLSPNLLGGGIATDAGQGTGIYAMIIDGPWMVGIYQQSYPDFKPNFAPIPAGKNGTSSVVGGEDVVIMEGSKNKEAAAKWVSYLMSIEAQKTMATVGIMPTIASLTGDPSLPAYFAVFMEQLKTAQARVPSPHWTDMDTAINNAYQRILRGDQSVQEALDQAANEINALLTE